MVIDMEAIIRLDSGVRLCKMPVSQKFPIIIVRRVGRVKSAQVRSLRRGPEGGARLASGARLNQGQAD